MVNVNYFSDTLAKVADILNKSGAETRLIIQTTERVAKAFGYQDAKVVINPDMITILVNSDNNHFSYNYPCTHSGLNMHVLLSVTRLCIEAENHKLNIDEFRNKLSQIKFKTYNNFVIIGMIGLATAAFSFFIDQSWIAFLCSFICGSVTMGIRIIFQRYHLFQLFIFYSCGFFSTIFAYLICNLLFGLSKGMTTDVMSVSVLLLFPGFPFINGILDLVKGYTFMGIYRLINTILLLLFVSIGITTAFMILPYNYTGW